LGLAQDQFRHLEFLAEQRQEFHFQQDVVGLHERQLREGGVVGQLDAGDFDRDAAAQACLDLVGLNWATDRVADAGQQAPALRSNYRVEVEICLTDQADDDQHDDADHASGNE